MITALLRCKAICGQETQICQSKENITKNYPYSFFLSLAHTNIQGKMHQNDNLIAPPPKKKCSVVKDTLGAKAKPQKGSVPFGVWARLLQSSAFLWHPITPFWFTDKVLAFTTIMKIYW